MKVSCALFGIICVTLLLCGCSRFVCEIHQRMDSRGSVNINIHTDANNARVNITIDNVPVDLEDLQRFLEQKKGEKKHRRKSGIKPYGTF